MSLENQKPAQRNPVASKMQWICCTVTNKGGFLLSQESKEKTTLTAKQKKPRDRLFQVLNDILTFAEQKRKTVNLADKTKQSWSRISIAAISTYGGLLHDYELDI